MPARRLLTTTCLALTLLLLVAVPARADGCTLLGQLLTCEPDPEPTGFVRTPEGLLTVAGGGGSASPSSGVAPGVYPEGARRLLELANQERATVGLAPLVSRPDLVELALKHTWAMVEQESIFHNLDLLGKPLRAVLGATVVGENVGWSTDVDDLHRRLMASPGHRASLLEPRFSVVGMAVVHTENGRFYATQDFAAPNGATPPAPAPAPRPTPAPRARPATPAVPVPTEAPVTVDKPAPATTVTAPISQPVVDIVEPAPAPPTLGDVAGLLASDTGPRSASADRTGLVALAAALAAIVALGNGACAMRERRRA